MFPNYVEHNAPIDLARGSSRGHREISSIDFAHLNSNDIVRSRNILGDAISVKSFLLIRLAFSIFRGSIDHGELGPKRTETAKAVKVRDVSCETRGSLG